MTNRLPIAALALLLTLPPLQAIAAEGQGPGKPQPSLQPPRSLIQKLRAFLGLNPPVAVGGSRSSGSQTVCLLSPWPNTPIGISAPVIEAAGPLNEVRLEKAGQVIWQQRASSTQAIEGPITWPIAPLKPGEQITLKLRPRGASGADFASFSLRAADAPTLQSNQLRVQSLGSDPKAWIAALDQLTQGQASQAAALLSSPQAPAQLRQSLKCSAPSWTMPAAP